MIVRRFILIGQGKYVNLGGLSRASRICSIPFQCAEANGVSANEYQGEIGSRRAAFETVPGPTVKPNWVGDRGNMRECWPGLAVPRRVGLLAVYDPVFEIVRTR